MPGPFNLSSSVISLSSIQETPDPLVPSVRVEVLRGGGLFQGGGVIVGRGLRPCEAEDEDFLNRSLRESCRDTRVGKG